MNNIEKLAKTHCIGTYQNSEDGERFYFRLQDLEAFAKALQSSEPVAKVIHTKGTGLLEGKTITKVMLDINHVDLPAGTELFTHPPASVPLEKYNKLLDALNIASKAIKYAKDNVSVADGKRAYHDDVSYYLDVLKAIAEAEGKEG